MAWNIGLPDAEWYTPADASTGIAALVADLKNEEVCTIALDTETTGLNVVQDIPIYWSLSWIGASERRICMPASTMPYFQDIFDDPNKEWIFANAKYDMHMLANVGYHLAGDCIDTQVMHALLYEESPHGLKDMARELLGWKWTDFKDTFGILRGGATIGESLQKMEIENLQKLIEYAANDAYGTLKIFYKLRAELQATNTFSLYPNDFETLWDIFIKTEMPFTRVLWKMERRGVMIDAAYLKSIEGPCQTDIDRIAREINQLAGKMMNPASNPQIRKYFFDDLGLRHLTLTKGGKKGIKVPQLDASFLEHHAFDPESPGQPMAKLHLEWRELSKLKGTYIDGLQSRMDKVYRIHTRYNQDVARTGRLSSSDPNLQNIPTAENDKFKLRGAFIPKPGYELIVADYEALEMRLLACASLEPQMIQIFLDGKDIHMGNGAMVFGKKYGINYDDIKAAKKVDKEIKEGKRPESDLTQMVKDCLFARQAAKTIGFGLNYGMKEDKLARGLGCTPKEAKVLMEEYMDTYPAVRTFYAEAIEETRGTGYSFTLIGRRRYHPEILSSRNYERWEAERKCVNNQIQGTAADVVRFAMLMCDSAELDKKYGCNMLMQVHDELVFECPTETVVAAKEEIKHLMEHPFVLPLAVPLTVSIGSGPSWLHAK